MGVWINSLNNITNNNIVHEDKNTIETYSQIRDLGLETVFWETFSHDQFLKSLKQVEQFIKKYHPCLFIFDPLTKNVAKGYLCDVNDVAPVLKWITDNKNQISQFRYLMTTQICNPGTGFVGAVFSDGKGNIYCETLHIPEIKDSQNLSQPKRDFDKYLMHFSTEHFEPVMIDGCFLDRTKIMKIINAYAHHTGYFEFVYGVQSGKHGLYTTGYEIGEFFTFPHEFYKSILDIRGKMNCLLLREGFL